MNALKNRLNTMFMRKHFTISLVLFLGSQLIAQEREQVALEELAFHSDFEEAVLEEYASGQAHLFDLFLAADKSVDNAEAESLRDDLDAVLGRLAESDVASKKPKKAVEMIHETLDMRFFQDYVSTVPFSNTLEDGDYNFVTSAMLYVLVLEKFNIPYKVMGSMKNAYIVVDPGPKSLLLEAENPNSERHDFSEDAYKLKIREFKYGGEIPEGAMDNQSIEELFAARYDDVEAFSVYFLPGMQYYYLGNDHMEKGDYAQAFDLMQKAYFFYPVEKVDMLRASAFLVLIEREDFNEVRDADMLSYYAGMQTADNDIVLNVFQKKIQQKLNEGRSHVYCDSLFNRLYMQLEDEKLKNSISLRYNKRMAEHFRDSVIAEPYLQAAYLLNSEDKDLKQTIEIHFHNYFSRIYDDPAKFLNEVKRVEKETNYPFLDERLNYYKLLALLKMSALRTEEDKLTEAGEYIREFEEAFDPAQMDEIMEQLLVRSYRGLAVKLFYLNRKAEAREIVDSGLKFVPDNSYLKSAVY